MAIELVCSCGQVLRFDEPPPGGQARCPDCNALLTLENDRSMLAAITHPPPVAVPPATTRKPLWELMARDQDRLATPQQPGDTAKETIASDAEPALPANERSGSSSGRKGLWSLMQTAAAGRTPTVKSHPGGPILFESVPGPESPEENPGAYTPGSPEQINKSEIPPPKKTASHTESPSDSLAAMFGMAADEALLSAQSKAAGFHADNSRRALASAVMGALSIPLSGVALVDSAWSRMPATALGFVAILTGLIASQEIERSAGRKTGRRLAIAGIVTGIVGVFLGPLVIAPFGRPRKGN